MDRIVTWEEFGEHITPKDTWILVDGSIYNVSDYLVEHPGGDDILVKYIICSFLDIVELTQVRNFQM